jgi:XTP/dITP diphosphohydrolase
MRLVFASNNAHKLSEVQAIMPAGVEVLSLKEIGFNSEIEETGSTLSENSYIKARTVWEFICNKESDLRDQIDGVFADDTGLEIDALGGAPGVYTARWYKKNTNHCVDGIQTAPLTEKDIFAANRAKALRELEGKDNRGCQFKTVITLIRKPIPSLTEGKEFIQVEGIVRGRIAEEEYGQGGFGYDPIFVPEGYDKTFGELPAELKNHISHRARAMQALVNQLNKEA